MWSIFLAMYTPTNSPNIENMTVATQVINKARNTVRIPPLRPPISTQMDINSPINTKFITLYLYNLFLIV